MRLKKIVLYAAGLLAIGALVVTFWLGWGRKDSQTTKKDTQKTEHRKLKPSGSLTFAAMGDMLAHDSIVAQAKTAAGYDFKPYFKQIRPLYQKADVVFCNPETLSAGPEYGVSGYPAFNAPKEFAGDLVTGARCDVINLATNHINDKGQAAVNATLDVWDKQSVLAKNGANRSSDEQMKIAYFSKNGVKIAFLAFADYSNNTSLNTYTVNFYHDTAFVRTLVSEARQNADAVIVSAHWGTEDSTTVNADQKAAAQLFADSGADVVIGTGPHVLQPVHYLTSADGRKTLVWYSIGNMLSSQLKIEELTGIIAGFTLTKQQSGGVKVSSPTANITYMSYEWSAADKAADRLEARRNLMLQPLHAAADKPAVMFGSGHSVSERESFVKTTLTQDASVAVTP